MLIEHITFTLAIAILASIFYPQIKGAYLWIFTLAGCLPDIDAIFDLIHTPLTFSSSILATEWVHTRVFHNISMLIICATIGGIILSNISNFKVDLRLAISVIGAGFASHLLEDTLTYNPSPAVLSPLSAHRFSMGIIPYNSDPLGFASIGTLIASIGLILFAIWIKQNFHHIKGSIIHPE